MQSECLQFVGDDKVWTRSYWLRVLKVACVFAFIEELTVQYSRVTVLKDCVL